jgi:hypothetical protein
MIPGLNSIRRALADYSLRKFILYAAVPSHWPGLLEARQKARAQVLDFSHQVADWLKLDATASAQLSFVFRPWLKEAGTRDLASGQRQVPPAASPDPEVALSRDRLGWMLQMALDDRTGAWQAVEAWLAARWESGLACRDAYSVSERLSNLILMWNLQAPPEPVAGRMLRLMAQDADHLLAHIEYHGESKTNNHVLNNARALILFGGFTGSARFYESGCSLFASEFPKHVLADGLLREGSSHYQWVVSRWVLEIGCTFHARDHARFLQLQPMLEKMLDVCDAMKLGPPGANFLPLIGDISPDFPPSLYAGLTGFGFALTGSGDEDLSAAPACGGLWSSLFVRRSIRNAETLWMSSDRSWARVTTGAWSMLAHADMHPHDNRPTHGHHDLFSFELAFDGMPLVVDPGRRNYLAARDSEEAGVLEEWHNTLLVDQCRTGLVPRGYMPTRWLEQWRTRPELEANVNGMEIRLVAPREVRGVSRIQRTIDGSDPNRLVITNQVCKSTPRSVPVLLVLYLMGEVRQAGPWVELELADKRFTLSWTGLDRPRIRTASRYVSYDCAEPCTRLEWTSVAGTGVWESTITISLAGNQG